VVEAAKYYYTKQILNFLFRFPIMNPPMMKIWMKSIGNGNFKNPQTPIHKTSIICSEHFETKHFKYAGMRTRIMPDAVPTIFKTANISNNVSFFLLNTINNCASSILYFCRHQVSRKQMYLVQATQIKTQ